MAAIGAEAVAADQLEPAGALAAAALGLPWATIACALPLNREPGLPPPFTAWRYESGETAMRRNRAGWRVQDFLMQPLFSVIAGWASARGLPQRTLDDTFSPLAQISQMTRSLDFPRRELPPSFHYVGPIRWEESAPEWRPRQTRKRLVFASLGTLQGHRADLFAAIAAAAASLDVDLLIVHCGRLEAAAAAALPGAPEVRDFVDQRDVLAHSAALVGHGGLNTVMDAVAAGVPAVIAPLAFEQAAIATRLERAGAGIMVGRWFRRRRIRDALRAVLEDPGYRHAASVLQREAASAGGADRAADIIACMAEGASTLRPPRIPHAAAASYAASDLQDTQ